MNKTTKPETKYVGYPERMTFERKDVEFEIEVDMSISGRYRPAKIHGDPDSCYEAEYPELEVHAIHAINVLTHKPMPRALGLTDAEQDRLERKIIADAMRPRDDYDGY